jgi:hypothetical protein
MTMLRILLCFAFPFALSCSESSKEGDIAVALDGPEISKSEERDMLKRASSGDVKNYNTLIVWYLNERRYDDALSIAVNFAEHDSELATEHLCELKRVYRVELDSEAIKVLGGSSKLCGLET